MFPLKEIHYEKYTYSTSLRIFPMIPNACFTTELPPFLMMYDGNKSLDIYHFRRNLGILGIRGNAGELQRKLIPFKSVSYI